MCKLQEFLGDGFEHLKSVNSFEKASLMLCSVLWEDDFSLILVKDMYSSIFYVGLVSCERISTCTFTLGSAQCCGCKIYGASKVFLLLDECKHFGKWE